MSGIDGHVLTILVVGLALGLAQSASVADEPSPGGKDAPVCVRDRLWVWGNPLMAEPGPRTLATYAKAGPAERAKLLGTPNVIMAGAGVPDDDALALALAEEAAGSPRLVWEIAPDKEDSFDYDQRIARLKRLADRYPEIEGVLLDDMSSLGVDAGFKPEHVRHIRESLSVGYEAIDVWGVVYSMNLEREGIEQIMAELDVINLWIWHAKDVVDIKEYVRHCKRLFPKKPVVLGLYMYDYGDGRRMPLDLLETQCTTALKLLHKGDIEGIVFLSITDDPEAVMWTADWIATVADQPLGKRRHGKRATRVQFDLASDQDWLFAGGEWSQDEEGVVRPLDTRNLHSRAFLTDTAFGDLRAEFEFNGNYRETGTGSAGLILRAQDPDHFYLVYFPWGGQQLRAKHFWAAVAKVDGDGYLRHIAAQWVPGLPSETDRWYRVRVEAEGSAIRVWVDDLEALCVTDDTYESGGVGLAGYGWYAFRNVRVVGKEVKAFAWPEAAEIPAHAFTVGLPSEHMPTGCIAPNGDVLLAGGRLMVRSTDKGRTWEAPETLPEKLGELTDYGSAMFCTRAGKLQVMLYRAKGEPPVSPPEISLSESQDNGRTWSEPEPCAVGDGWPSQPKSLVPYGPLVENRDGVLMRFLLGGVREENLTYTDVRTWGVTHCKAYVIRSVDEGRSWTAPIELDRPSWCDKERGTLPGSLDFTEPTGVVMGNRVTVLIRPVYSPYMWQCWSYDGGATWDAAVRSTFPGYAQSMTRTASGALVCAHRYPHYAVNVSRDDGLHWDAGTVIDYPVWAMGGMLEVEPNIVLATYMNAYRDMLLLAQLIRVETDGIYPIAP